MKLHKVNLTVDLTRPVDGYTVDLQENSHEYDQILFTCYRATNDLLLKEYIVQDLITNETESTITNHANSKQKTMTI